MTLHKHLIFLFIFIFSSIKIVTAQGISGNGNVIKKERPVSAFTSIKTSNGWDLELTQGNSHTLVIEADENLVDLVKTEIQGNTLIIHSEANINRSKMRKIHLTFVEVNTIEASGGADVVAKNDIQSGDFSIKCSGGSDLSLAQLSCDHFDGQFSGGSDANIGFSACNAADIIARGGSDLLIKEIKAEKLTLDLMGGSDAKLMGQVENLELNGAGGSDVSATNLEVKMAKIYLAGASDGKFNILDKLDLSLSGGSDFECKGKPELTHKDICRSCDVRM
ncbi:MAG: DUF2807 domain-containing protein [Saprospiraceae bacterium]|nr:DUF2807 domain-containing protein [Saprospiraceae bacterium]